MNRKPVLQLLGLTGAGAALATALMSCGGPASVGAAHPAASQVSATQPASRLPGSPVTTPARPKSRNDTAAPGTGSPGASSSAAPSPRVSAPAGGTPLRSGLYTDAPDGTPHYVIALSLSGRDGITGSVTYMYQDGRVGPVSSYTGTLSGGKLTVTFGGKALAGRYTGGDLTLASCGRVLTWATAVPSGCRFTYHGHVP